MCSDVFKMRKLKLSVTDVITTVFTYVLSVHLAGNCFGLDVNFASKAWILLAAMFMRPTFLKAVNAYNLGKKTANMVAKVIAAELFLVGSISLTDTLVSGVGLSMFYYLLLGIGAAFSIINRLVVRAASINKSQSDEKAEKYVVVGDYDQYLKFKSFMRDNSDLGLAMGGYVGVEPGAVHQRDYLGDVFQLSEIIRDKEIDEIIIALSAKQQGFLPQIIEYCDKEGIRPQIVPEYQQYIPNLSVAKINGIPVLRVGAFPLDHIANRIIKRVFDICFSAAVLIALSPVYLAVGLMVKLTSSGPVFYTQERVGLNNRTFKIYKYRSMTVQDAKSEKNQWTTRNDPRVTPIGKFIRSTSIDELPQFWNVFIGNMSVVGPRPERPQWVEKFKEDIPDYMRRHYSKAGITGWAQVNGWRGDTSISERIKCDNWYVTNWSLTLDIRIIFMTVFHSETAENAY